jgi:hypothetical protein
MIEERLNLIKYIYWLRMKSLIKSIKFFWFKKFFDEFRDEFGYCKNKINFNQYF